MTELKIYAVYGNLGSEYVPTFTLDTPSQFTPYDIYTVTLPNEFEGKIFEGIAGDTLVYIVGGGNHFLKDVFKLSKANNLQYISKYENGYPIYKNCTVKEVK